MAEPDAAIEAHNTLIDSMRVISRGTGGEHDALDAAAALAVLREVLIEEAESRHDATTQGDAWARSQRATRPQLHPGPGQWRGFSG